MFEQMKHQKNEARKKKLKEKKFEEKKKDIMTERHSYGTEPLGYTGITGGYRENPVQRKIAVLNNNNQPTILSMDNLLKTDLSEIVSFMEEQLTQSEITLADIIGELLDLTESYGVPENISYEEIWTDNGMIPGWT